MTKTEFLRALRERSSGLSQNEIEERLLFYSEMIDDKIEEGLSEEEAVATIEISDEAAARTEAVTEKPCNNKQRRRLKAWEIVLMAVGSPLWISLAAVALAVAIVLYASVWAVLISLWAVGAAFAGGAIGGVSMGIVMLCGARVPEGIAMLGAGIALAGLSIMMFFGCKALTRLVIRLTALTFRAVFSRKGEKK